MNKMKRFSRLLLTFSAALASACGGSSGPVLSDFTTEIYTPAYACLLYTSIAAAAKTALSERIMKNYAYVKDAKGLSLYSEIASSTNPRPIYEFGCI